MKIAVELLPDTSAEEERFLYLNNLNETRRDAALANEAHKKRIKAQYDKSIQPCAFNEGDLVLNYDQRYEKLGKGKFEGWNLTLNWQDSFESINKLERCETSICFHQNVGL